MVRNKQIEITSFFFFLFYSLIVVFFSLSFLVFCFVLLSHLLVAGCDIGVRFSVRPSVRQSVRPSVNIYVDVRHLCQS